jgi:hypothetical protein
VAQVASATPRWQKVRFVGNAEMWVRVVCGRINGSSGECDSKGQRWTRNVGGAEALVRVVCGPSGRHSSNA